MIYNGTSPNSIMSEYKRFVVYWSFPDRRSDATASKIYTLAKPFSNIIIKC